MQLEYIDKDFFKDPKRLGVPMVSLNQQNGAVSFNEAAIERYDLSQYAYFIFARDPEKKGRFFIVPTIDRKRGWKLTKYKNQLKDKVFMRICSKHLVHLVARACDKVSENTFHMYMHLTDKQEKGKPMFELLVKNF